MPTRTVLALSILLAAAAGSLARADTRFVHTSDPHVNTNASPQGNAAIDARMLAEISALEPTPSVVVNTGDLVDYGTDVEYAALRRLIGGFAIPWRHTLGNHDVRWNPLGKEGFTLGTGQPTFQTFDVDGIQFFLLDSTVLLEHWGHISQQQLDWLAGELKKIGTAKPVVIAFHHWIGRDTVQVDNEQDLIDLVRPYHVVLWLQGHGHSDLLWNVDGVPAIMERGLYQGSYSVIDVVGDRLIITRRSEPTSTRKGELIVDKDGHGDKTPTTQAAGVWTNVGPFPMRATSRPAWTAEAAIEERQLVVTVPSENNLTPDAELSARVDGAGPRVQLRERQGGWQASVDAQALVPGPHAIDVVAKLPDGRQLRRGASVAWFPDETRPAWQTPLGGAVQSRLVLDNGALYVTTMAGTLTRLDPATGTVAWTFRAGDAIFSAPCVAGEVAIVGSADHNVYAINASDGSVKWKTPTKGGVMAGAAIARGVACIASADKAIYGLDVATGEVKWTVQGGNLFQSVAATDGERFYVGGWDNYFRCIDATSGKELWKQFLGRPQTMLPQFSAYAPAITSPAVADGLAYVSTNDGILHALRTVDGVEAWQIDRKKMGYSSPLVHDGVVYCCLSDESLVFATDAKTGAIRWEKPTGHVVYDGSFAWADGRVVIPCVDGTLIAYDAGTGDVAWQQRLDHGHLLSTPVADGEHLYAASMLGIVNAIPLRR